MLVIDAVFAILGGGDDETVVMYRPDRAASEGQNGGTAWGRLDGKVAIVTGGARGQGEAEARLFASEGAWVVIGDVLDEVGEALAAELGADGVRAPDVSDEAEWEPSSTRPLERFGRVDVLVNNAGIGHSAHDRRAHRRRLRAGRRRQPDRGVPRHAIA